MAYKFQKGSATLSGSITLTNILTSTAQISGSSFWGDGAGLSGVSSDSVDVTARSDDLNYTLVGVTAAGSDVTLVADNSTKINFNPSTGGLGITGSLSTNALTASVGFMLGSTAITATGAELNYVDVTAGTGAASKAVVLNANSDWNGASSQLSASVMSASSGHFKDLTVSADSLVVGTTTISETEIEYLDGITAGITAASKAVILDSNQNIGTFNQLSGTLLSGTYGYISQLTLESFNGNWTNAGNTVANLGTITTVDINGGSIDGANIGAADPRAVNAGALTASAGFMVGTTAVTATGAELNYVDVTAGTAAASKAVVLSSAKDIAGIGTITGSSIKAILDESSFLAMDIGGGYGSTGVTISSAGTITANGHLTASIVSGSEVAAEELYSRVIDVGSSDWSTTGNSYVAMADNLAEAWFVAESQNTYLAFCTTNGSEAVKIGTNVDGNQPELALYGAYNFGGQLKVAADVTLTTIDYSHYICNGTGSSKLQLNLPAASNGNALNIKRHPDMTASVQINANGNETIDDSTDSVTLDSAGGAVFLVASGSDWYLY